MADSNSNTGRREFLQQSVVGTAAAGLAITSTSHVTAQTIADAAEPEVTNEVDVPNRIALVVSAAVRFRSCELASQLKCRVNRRASATPGPFSPATIFLTLHALPAPRMIRY